MKKMTKKTTSKVFVPAYIVDLTKAETAEDTVVAFVLAKLSACCTYGEITTLVNEIVRTATEIAYENVFSTMAAQSVKININDGTKVVLDQTGIKVKKPNVFKRFWNWITRKNK